MKKKILITGGHLTPALAVIESLPKKDWDITYLGRKYALEGDSAVSAEYTTITAQGIHFEVLKTGRLQRKLTVHTIGSLFKIIQGIWESFRIIRQLRPSIVLSFGGYVALPVALVAWASGIPVITHEQTMRPGLANRIIGYFARAVCVSWPDTVAFFPGEKTICTGNPLRASLFKSTKKLPLSVSLPLLYITGGSLGSQSVNRLIEPIIPALLRRFTIVHQCGAADNNRDYKRLQKLTRTLPKQLQKRYYVAPFINPENVGWILRTATLVVCRSGANTITEIIAFQKPSVLIPLPWSGSGEQLEHAQFMADHDAAVMVAQETATAQQLQTAISDVSVHAQRYQQALKRISIPDPATAARTITTLLEQQIAS